MALQRERERGQAEEGRRKGLGASAVGFGVLWAFEWSGGEMRGEIWTTEWAEEGWDEGLEQKGKGMLLLLPAAVVTCEE